MSAVAEAVVQVQNGAAASEDYREPWVVARIEHGLYALTSRLVREMVSMPTINTLPEAPPHVRGLINLRGQALPLVDLRVRLGLPSLRESTAGLEELMRQREQDHLRWVNELRKSIQERRPFTLTTDPHACAFGKWYDNYRTDNLLLTAVLRRFDLPHKQLHETGKLIVDAMLRQDYGWCEQRLHQLETTSLKAMVALFAEAREVLHDTSHEIALVVLGAQPFAVAVDAIEAVERLSPATGRSDTPGTDASSVDGVARRQNGGLVLTVSPEGLL